MPEICEVVLTAQYLLSKLKGRHITNIEILSGKYKHKKLEGIDLIEMYSPLEVINIDTKGKFMWFELKNKDTFVYILNSFGLTGEWSFFKSQSDRIVFTISNNDKDNNTYKLYYSDQRNMGNIKITTDKNILDEKLNKLAPDLLKSTYTNQDFVEWTKKFIMASPRRKNMLIVKVLLNQNIDDGIGSGIGNYLVAEILYRARISPCRSIGSLSDEELLTLAQTIKKVLKMCYMSNKTGYMKKLSDFVDIHKVKVKEGKFPNYLPEIPDDEEFSFMVYRKKKDIFENPVCNSKLVNGRSTYWVPNIQK